MAGSDATIHGLPLVDGGAPSLRLTVQQGPDVGAVIECHRVVTLLGSRPGCKIRLNHPLVSPVHLAIINDGHEIHAVDLVTHHGTKLNDLKLEYERLSHGDVLAIEPWVLGVSVRKGRGASANGTPSIALEFAPSVIALEHLESGRVLQPGRAVSTIGRRSGCDIQLQDSGVSRAHALLFTHGDHPVIVDLQSQNGTYVNDKVVSYRQLADNDVIRVGDSRFQLRVLVPSASKPKSKSASEVPLRPNPAATKTMNGRNGAAAPEGDLVDIQAVEGSQRWRIADKLEPPPAKRRVAQ